MIGPSYRLRGGREDDLEACLRVKRSGAQAFAGLDLGPPPRPRPNALAALDLCRAAGTLWVIADDADRPVAFLAARDVDGSLYIADLFVALAHQRQGLGTRLLNAAIAHGRWAYYPAVSLITDRLIPWNAPYYARHGFVALRTDGLSPTLKALFDEMVSRGHDPARRVAMAKVL